MFGPNVGVTLYQSSESGHSSDVPGHLAMRLLPILPTAQHPITAHHEEGGLAIPFGGEQELGAQRLARLSTWIASWELGQDQ